MRKRYRGYAPCRKSLSERLPTPKGMSSVEFVSVMLEKTGIVVPPGNGCGEYGEGYFRIALTKDTETLKECIRRMKDAGIRYE